MLLLYFLQEERNLALHPSGLPLTAKPLIDAGLLFDEDGVSIKHNMTRVISGGDLVSLGNAATNSSSEPSGGPGLTSAAGPAGDDQTSTMRKSASYSALSSLDSSAAAVAAAAAANANMMGGGGFPGLPNFNTMGGMAGMPRVQSVPHSLQSYMHMESTGSPVLHHHGLDSSNMMHGSGLPSYGGMMGAPSSMMHPMGMQAMKPAGTYWNTELSYQVGVGHEGVHTIAPKKWVRKSCVDSVPLSACSMHPSCVVLLQAATSAKACALSP